MIAELLRYGRSSNVAELNKAAKQVLTKISVTQHLEVNTIKLLRKGKLSDCYNWRGTTLFLVPGKALCCFLFLLVTDFVMQKSMIEANVGILWKDWMQLTGLNFVNEIVLIVKSRGIPAEHDHQTGIRNGKIELSDKTNVMQIVNPPKSMQIKVIC